MCWRSKLRHDKSPFASKSMVALPPDPQIASKTQQPRRISLDDLPNSSKPKTVPAQLVNKKDDESSDPVVTIVRGADKRQSYRVPDERTISRNAEIITTGPRKNRTTQNGVPNVSRGTLAPASPPPLTGWRTRWSQDIANAVNPQKKKEDQEQPAVPLPQ